MSFQEINDAFSRRQRVSPKPVSPLPLQFRNRVIMLCMDLFDQYKAQYDFDQFWEELHDKFRYLVGREHLTQDRRTHSVYEDIRHFLTSCSNEHFLDFIEFIFQTSPYDRQSHIRRHQNLLVPDINQWFLFDDLPYALTFFVHERQTERINDEDHERVVLISSPKVIRRDDQATYVLAIEPALLLLRDTHFTSANNEFREALDDYRQGDYGDCLTKCGSAFESTMKLICVRNGWTYSQKDTAQPLLQTIIKESQMETFFEQPLMLIATIRNRLSKSHGSGTQDRRIPEHVAKYAINATAAAILFLVDACP
jgi:Abortive infection C-terminus